MKWWKWMNLSMECLVLVYACVCGLCSVSSMCVWNLWFFVAQGLPPCLWQDCLAVWSVWPHKWLWSDAVTSVSSTKGNFRFGIWSLVTLQFVFIELIALHIVNIEVFLEAVYNHGSLYQIMAMAGRQTCVGWGWPNFTAQSEHLTFQNFFAGASSNNLYFLKNE
jgi:hypothetical protein